MSIGEQIITEIVKQGMVQVSYPKEDAENTAVFVWRQNAAEQLDALVAQHVKIALGTSSDKS